MSIKFKHSEIKGAIVLSIIIFIFAIIKHAYFNLVDNNTDIKIDDITLQERYQNFIQEHKMDLNILDEEQCTKLGIYKNISISLLKYRDLLGGFVFFEQLSEVKNINEQTIKVLKEFTYIDVGYHPRQLDINNDDFKTLLRHPYLNFEDVKNICNYRKFEKIKNIETLEKEKILKMETIKKIEPYLKFC